LWYTAGCNEMLQMDRKIDREIDRSIDRWIDRQRRTNHIDSHIDYIFGRGYPSSSEDQWVW